MVSWKSRDKRPHLLVQQSLRFQGNIRQRQPYLLGAHPLIWMHFLKCLVFNLLTSTSVDTSQSGPGPCKPSLQVSGSAPSSGDEQAWTPSEKALPQRLRGHGVSCCVFSCRGSHAPVSTGGLYRGCKAGDVGSRHPSAAGLCILYSALPPETALSAPGLPLHQQAT